MFASLCIEFVKPRYKKENNLGSQDSTDLSVRELVLVKETIQKVKQECLRPNGNAVEYLA